MNAILQLRIAQVPDIWPNLLSKARHLPNNSQFQFSFTHILSGTSGLSYKHTSPRLQRIIIRLLLHSNCQHVTCTKKHHKNMWSLLIWLQSNHV